MRRYLISALAVVLAPSAGWAACDGTGGISAGASGWRLAWSDEFDAEQIDFTRWNREVDCWGGGNEERQCYTPFDQNSRLEEGCLVIEAHLGEAEGPAWPEHLRDDLTEEQLAETNRQPFTSARLNTRNKGDWRYGRIEVRARLPEGQGTWPAIWMLPTDEVYGGWALSGEIDILEAVNLGEECRECDGRIENRMFGTLHFGGAWPENVYQNRNTTLPMEPGEEQDFHVFAIEWTEGEVEWFLDGESYGSLTPRNWRTDSPLADGNPNAPFDQRFFLILNLAIGGHLAESRTLGGVRVEGYPRQFLIDWVRVYDCPGDLETARACAS
ncbi:MAG: glycoside hydrolase family 16 protein [Alphaproteobacteria bacterium]|nr:glycoside hydrolase family 16 protein [Alphaproteobacteria bacterium]